MPLIMLTFFPSLPPYFYLVITISFDRTWNSCWNFIFISELFLAIHSLLFVWNFKKKKKTVSCNLFGGWSSKKYIKIKFYFVIRNDRFEWLAVQLIRNGYLRWKLLSKLGLLSIFASWKSILALSQTYLHNVSSNILEYWNIPKYHFCEEWKIFFEDCNRNFFLRICLIKENKTADEHLFPIQIEA